MPDPWLDFSKSLRGGVAGQVLFNGLPVQVKDFFSYGFPLFPVSFDQSFLLPIMLPLSSSFCPSHISSIPSQSFCGI